MPDRKQLGSRPRASVKPGPTPRRPVVNPFVQYELSTEQQVACKAASISMDDMSSYLQRYMEAGYKLSVRYDERTEAIAAWLIAPDEGDQNAGLILSGRGSSAMKAVKQLLWKDAECVHGEWFKFTGPSRSVDIDD